MRLRPAASQCKTMLLMRLKQLDTKHVTASLEHFKSMESSSMTEKTRDVNRVEGKNNKWRIIDFSPLKCLHKSMGSLKLL